MGTAVARPEESRLVELETTIERGLVTFVEVGAALMEIRDNRLYTSEFATFEAYCQERWSWGRNYVNKQIAAAKVAGTLGTIVPNEAVARELASIDEPERVREVWTEAVDRHGSEPTAAEVREIARPHVANNAGNNEWYTPPEILKAARRTMGSIDTDPASSAVANKTVQAGQYFDAETNGLGQTWSGNVWMNPPYAQPLIEKFCEAVAGKFASGEIVEACVLVNNATETAWFQTLLAAAKAVCFPRSRIRFLDTEGNPGAPLQGQAIVYFGKDAKPFMREFAQFGKVLYG